MVDGKNWSKGELEMSDKSDAFAKQVETVVREFEASLAGRDWSMSAIRNA